MLLLLLGRIRAVVDGDNRRNLLRMQRDQTEQNQKSAKYGSAKEGFHGGSAILSRKAYTTERLTRSCRKGDSYRMKNAHAAIPSPAIPKAIPNPQYARWRVRRVIDVMTRPISSRASPRSQRVSRRVQFRIPRLRSFSFSSFSLRSSFHLSRWDL